MTKEAGGALEGGGGERRGPRCGASGRRTLRWSIIGAMAAVAALANPVAAQQDPQDEGPLDAIPIESPQPEPSVDCRGTAAVGGSARTDELINDCEVLLAARDTLDPEGRLNWSTGVYMGHWTGIRLAGSPTRVDRIHLPFRRLSGEIPAGLGELTAPTYIKLNYNDLTGPIPPELGNLTELRQLILNNNQLTGSIPSELGNLTELTHLQLDRNDLSGLIPPELGNLAKVRELWLGYNNLTGCIPLVLYEAYRFDRERSLFPSMPACAPEACKDTDAVGESDVDVRLRADCDVLLDAKPQLDPGDELNWSTKLAVEDWDGVGIVETDHGRRVGTLDLSSRGLTGHIPVELSHLSALTELDLSRNRLTGSIPGALGYLSDLQILDLHGNLLRMTIPVRLGRLANLTVLNLSNNGLRNDIPPHLGNLGMLIELDLSDNLLSGEIPAALGNLARLERLALDDNRLTGEIPRELGDLAALEMTDVEDDRLAGEIPTELGRLAEVLLGGNDFSGCIPRDLLDNTRNDLDTLRLRACRDR